MTVVHLIKEDRHYENHMYCGLVDRWFYGADETATKGVYQAFEDLHGVKPGVLWTESRLLSTCTDCNEKEQHATPRAEEGPS